MEAEAPVKLFYMGVNSAKRKDWPIPGTQYKELYLTSKGAANSVRGDGELSFKKPAASGVDTYRYDPQNRCQQQW